MKISQFFTKLFMVIIDIGIFYCALMFSFLVRQYIVPLFYPEEFSMSMGYLASFFWIPLLLITLFIYNGFYTKRRVFWEEAKEIIKVVTLGMILIAGILTLLKQSHEFSRMILVLLWGFSLFLFPLIRYITKQFLLKQGFYRTNTLIIGAGNAGLSTARGFLEQAYLGYHVIGFIDDDLAKKETSIHLGSQIFPVLGSMASLENVINRYAIETVVVAIPSLPSEQLSRLVNTVHKYVRHIIVIPEIKGIALTNTKLHHLFSEQLFLLSIKNNLESPFNKILKRLFDTFLAILLFPFLLPLIAVLGFLIKWESPGAVFYGHRRIGENGKSFPVFKFRSMYSDSQERLEKILLSDPCAKEEWESNFKLKNDPRITKIGKFLRKTSLDELPQILNVFLGQMSFVGPRPVIQEEIHKYYSDYAEYYFMVKPGITGLWQVNGRSDTDYDYRVKIDTWYVLNWSLWLDIVILFKTVKVVLKQEGAY